MIKTADVTDAGTRTPEAVDAFLLAFFGAGNDVEFDPDPTSPVGAWLAPSLQALRTPSDVPVVLPRKRPEDDGRRTAYVLARDRRHATEVAELLTAFIGPSYSSFIGRPADLDPHDPVDRAVLDLVGDGLAFVLSAPGPARDRRMWTVLATMQRAVADRPARLTTVPKPVGRLLGEFEAALAAGESTASAELLEQLATNSGLSATNLAHLRIKRLARLGRDAELLRLPGLTDTMVTGPPLPVVDAVLTALFTVALADPLAADDPAAARAALVDRGAVVPALLDNDATRLSPQAATVLALAARIRDDLPVLRRLLRDDPVRAGIAGVAPAVVADLEQAAADGEPGPPPVVPEVPAPAAVSDWVDLIDGLAVDAEAARTTLAEERWRDWPRPADQDRELADALATLDDVGAQRAWRAVGAFIDAVGYQNTAAASAREFVTNAITYGRYSPGDLAAMVALTDIVLRVAPTRTDYIDLLNDLGADAARWMAPNRATVLLDLVELLARHACPDHDARLGLVTVLLDPLRRHTGLLDADQLAFAVMLSTELDAAVDWPPIAEADDGEDRLRSVTGTVLLYSLDEGAIDRTRTTLGHLAPQVRVVVNSETDGSPRMRQQARGADVIVLATRCATHAATGCIRKNASAHAIVSEADGSGSASLLRAAIAGLSRSLG
ncbi:hypothetical protein K1T35_11405 [Pseudonocardia sp. DSM 110487]|uniref:hypothetical protein n=1 Tax=Pseudonocardia sp. DSM 110487 TaxID=2865833 RepID=UPI001C6A587E|nr:hypothetical protein [Pseudonocardia sp. DSM 110487]QYN37786.1 hypothetical protein K1T35_11405 [Pseudonocardia sp. DSM 110487]